MDNLAEFHQEVFAGKFDGYCQKWVRLLNLGCWLIDYQMANVIGDEGSTQASCNVNTQLGHRATITFTSRMGFESDRVREDLVVHEHLHIVLDELAQFVYQNMPKEHHDYFTRLVEIAVSDMARALVEMNQ